MDCNCTMQHIHQNVQSRKTDFSYLSQLREQDLDYGRQVKFTMVFEWIADIIARSAKNNQNLI